MSTLSFSPTVKVFPCPNCHETINTSMQQCAFCGVPIDSAAAEVSAAITSRISAAVSDASYLSILGWALITFTVLMFVPFLGLVGGVGLIVLRVGIPIMAIRWWIRYGKLKSSDPDLKKARTRAIVMTVVAAFLIVNTGFNFVHKRTPPSAPVNINVPISTTSPSN